VRTRRLLSASLFSAILAAALPGAVYLNQSLEFVQPVFVDDVVFAKVQVDAVTPRARGLLCQCTTTCHVVRDANKEVVVVKGQAQVLAFAPQPGA
jgi:acyl dehydratase